MCVPYAVSYKKFIRKEKQKTEILIQNEQQNQHFTQNYCH